MSPIEIFMIPKNRIIGAMRRLFSMSPQHKHVKNRNIVDGVVGPRGGKMVRCDCCNEVFPYNKCQVDHIEPVISLDSSALETSLDVIAERMWCDVSNLQVVCHDCHSGKSKDENAIRRANKKAKKENA